MPASLRSLSDPEILSRTHALAGQERRVTLALLEHLNEVERRRLFLKNGFSSMFAYCTTHLRMSEPAAARRIRTARCLARFPELHALLEYGEVHLSSVCMVAKYLRPGNAADILARIRGRSRREVERIVAELEPCAMLPPDRVRTVVVPVVSAAPVAAAPVAVASTASVLSTPAVDRPMASAAAFTGPADPGVMMMAAPPLPTAASPRITVAGDSASTRSVEGEAAGNDRASSPSGVRFEHHAVIQFAASGEFLELLERVRSIASHRLPPNATFEQVFALVMGEYVKREDPQARHERRVQRVAGPRSDSARRMDAVPGRNAELQKEAVSRRNTVQNESAPARSPRQIPAGIRDRIYARDQGRCTYVGSDGMRCGSSRHVQVDHVVPVARGGGATPDNLRLLCAQHNRLEAERLMGRSAARGTGRVIAAARRITVAGDSEKPPDHIETRRPGDPVMAAILARIAQ